MAEDELVSNCQCGEKLVGFTSSTFAHPNMRYRQCLHYIPGSKHFHVWIGGHQCNDGCTLKEGGNYLLGSSKKLSPASKLGRRIKTDNDLLTNDVHYLMEQVESLELRNGDLKTRNETCNMRLEMAQAKIKDAEKKLQECSSRLQQTQRKLQITFIALLICISLIYYK